MMLIDQYLALAQPYLEQYGYLALFGILMLESMGLPLPGETVLISASLIASQGKLNMGLIFVTAWSAAVLGDNIGFAVGRFGGRRLLLRHGGRVGITEERLQVAEEFFTRYGPEIVIAARFLVVVRQLNGIIAGSAGMNWWRFLIYNMIGAALWVSTWSIGVYFIGSHLAVAMPWIHRAGYALGASLIAIAIVWCIRHRNQT